MSQCCLTEATMPLIFTSSPLSLTRHPSFLHLSSHFSNLYVKSKNVWCLHEYLLVTSRQDVEKEKPYPDVKSHPAAVMYT